MEVLKQLIEKWEAEYAFLCGPGEHIEDRLVGKTYRECAEQLRDAVESTDVAALETDNADLKNRLGVLLSNIPETFGDAIQRYPFIKCEPHEWDNRTTPENAIYLISALEKRVGELEDDKNTIYSDMNRIVPALETRISDLKRELAEEVALSGKLREKVVAAESRVGELEDVLENAREILRLIPEATTEQILYHLECCVKDNFAIHEEKMSFFIKYRKAKWQRDCLADGVDALVDDYEKEIKDILYAMNETGALLDKCQDRANKLEHDKEIADRTITELTHDYYAEQAKVEELEAAINDIESDNDYDAGLINDYGGGNVGWWQDYIRSEIEKCNEYWRDLISDINDNLEE